MIRDDRVNKSRNLCLMDVNDKEKSIEESAFQSLVIRSYWLLCIGWLNGNVLTIFDDLC